MSALAQNGSVQVALGSDQLTVSGLGLTFTPTGVTVSLQKPGDAVRLGMTSTVTFAAPTAPAIRLPLSALYNDKDQTAVWVVESDKVRRVPIQVAGASGNELLVASGLNPGQVVVTAGVNLLREGQKVSILGQQPAEAPAGAAQ